MTVRAWSGIAAMVVACAGPGCDAGCEEGPIEVTLGTGTARFVPLDEGDDVTVVFGPQGGWHIDVGARLKGVGPDAEVRPRVVRVTDDLDLTGDPAASLLLLADYDPTSCTGDALGVRAFLTSEAVDAALVCDLEGERLELSVEASDFGTRTAAASILVTARTDPAQPCP